MSDQQTFFPDLKEVTKLETLSKEDLIKNILYLQDAVGVHQHRADRLEQFVDRITALISLPEKEFLNIKDQLHVLRRKFYGRSSEKRPEKKDIEREAKKGRKRGKKILLPSMRYPDLGLVEEEQDFAEGHTPSCQHCEEPLQKMNETENSEVITVTQKIYHIIRRKRAKYRCTKCYSDIQTVPLEPRLKPGSSFSDAVAIDVVVAKYADHLPINRYVTQAERCGLKSIQPQTLIDQTHYLADALEPIYQDIKQSIQESKILQADETPWKMLEDHDEHKWFLWEFCNQKNVFYEAQDGRGSDKAESFLKACQAQYLVTDAYSGYPKATRDLEIKHVFCNAHARRYFVESEDNYPESAPMIAFYRELYQIEEKVRSKPPDEIKTIRQKESKPILDQMQVYCLKLQCLPKSSMGKAKNYFLKHFERLTRYLEDGCLPIDNNLSERSLRGPVLGRKNFYGNHSKRGAKTSAILYSIVESCKLNRVEPQNYLTKTLHAILNGKPYHTPAEFAALHKQTRFNANHHPG